MVMMGDMNKADSVLMVDPVLGTDLGLFQKSFSQSMNSKSVGRLIP